MIKFIKFSSFMIILLFFPISFYFNIIPINCNSENNSLIEDIDVKVYQGDDHWNALVNIYFQKDATQYINSIDWGEVYRNGSTFYVNISLIFTNETKEFPFTESANIYYLENLEDGNYTFKVYINGKLYKTENFIVEKIEPTLDFSATPWVKWNGEEWIARVRLSSNMVPKGIHWGDVIKTEDGFMINIIVEEWTGNISKYSYVYGEHNYSLGILPEGSYWFHAYVNGKFGVHVPFDVSRILMTFTEIWSTVTTTYTFIETYSLFNITIVYTVTVTDTHREGKDITTYISIKVKEKTETLTIKTIQKSAKEKFEIGQYIIPLSLFIIVIMATILLYYFLFKRGKYV